MAEEQSRSVKYMMEMVLNAPGTHFHLLGLKMESFAAGKACMSLPYQDQLSGNPDTGAMHGGPITTLLDSCFGLCVATLQDAEVVCPTLDLRIDYMGRAKPDMRVYAEGEVFRSTEHVVFVRGIAYQNDKARPIAHGVGTFARMLPPSAVKE